MKIRRLSVILAFALTISMGITATVLAVSSLEQNANVAPLSELEINAEYLQLEGSHISAQTFSEIKTRTKDTLSTTDVVKLKKTDVVEKYLTHNSSALSELVTNDGELLSVRADIAQAYGEETQRQLQYLTILSILSNEYADCVMYADTEYNLSFNRGFFPILFVCADYTDRGYATIEDYYKDIKAGVCQIPDSAFFVNYETECIWAINDHEFTNVFN